jgi:glycosyltransferase involved in cell wall biosynthesis
MAKKTLVILLPGFAKDENDTTCIPSAQSFILTLQRLYPAIEIIIIAFDYPFTKEPYRWHNIQVLPFNMQYTRRIKRHLQLYAVYRKIRAIHKQENVIGLLSFWCTYNALIGHYFSKLNHVKHYCWLRGQDAKKENKIFRFFSPKGSEVIALSNSLKETFFDNYKILVQHTIPMATDIAAFKEIADMERNTDILGVGSLIPLKQWDIFIAVIAAINRVKQNLRCVLCGQGTEKQKLINLIKQYKLEHVITLTGEIPHQEVLCLMKQSRILLHTSSYEGYAAVFSEALYAGCYCVSFVDPGDEKNYKWKIVTTKDEMIMECTQILSGDADYSAIVLHRMEDSVHQVMQLYDSTSSIT